MQPKHDPNVAPPIIIVKEDNILGLGALIFGMLMIVAMVGYGIYRLVTL